MTRNGFGNVYNWGLRTLVSTPAGLFAGTANPFGPCVATRFGNRVAYRDNPAGGLEVWVGRRATSAPPAHQSRRAASPVLVLAPPRSLSSVVTAMIGEHPELYAIPEIHLFVVDTVGELEYLYRTAGERRRDGLLRLLAELMFGAQTERTVESAFHWYRRRLDMTTADLAHDLADAIAPLALVDKSVSTVWNMDYLQRAAKVFPEARYVHLTRHPRANCESLMETIHHEPWVSRHMTPEGTTQPAGSDPDPSVLWLKIHQTIVDFLTSIAPERQARVAVEDVVESGGRCLDDVALRFELRVDEAALRAMLHPERSPFARVGPLNAPFGNDPKFLADPALRVLSAQRPASLLDPVPWRTDGGGFSEDVIGLAKEFDYE